MSGNTYTVQPGAPQQFTGASIPANSVIINTSSKGSIWISSNQSVAPGIGIELNPAASVTWIGKQLWAVLDPNAVDIVGNPTPVNFTLTDDISNINDPVAVAEALIIAGVPITYREVLLFNDMIGDDPTFPVSTPLLDVSTYSTIIVAAQNQVAGEPIVIRLDWGDATGISLFYDQFSLGANDPDASMFDAWIMPCQGATLQIDWNVYVSGANGPVALEIFGSNRPASNETLQVNNTQLPRTALLDTVVANTGVYRLPFTDSLPNYTTLNGLCEVSLIIGDSTFTGVLFFQYTANDGTAQNVEVIHPDGITSFYSAMFNHPNVPITWWIESTIDLTALTFFLSVVPAGPN